MKQGAALLLVVILTIIAGVISTTTSTTSTTAPSTSSSPSSLPPHGTTPTPSPSTSSPPPPPPPPPVETRAIQSPLPWSVASIMNPKEVLLQEIRSLDEDSTDVPINEIKLLSETQKYLVKANETELKKSDPEPIIVVPKKSSPLTKFKSDIRSDSELLQVTPRKGVSYFTELTADDDLNYNETEDILMADDDDDDDDDDEDDDDDDDDDDIDDDIIDDEEILFKQNCPTGCSCSEQFMGATTAWCTKFKDVPSFGSNIGHLKIQNAADFELGPLALRKKGLSEMQSFAIVDTKIIAIDKTAFADIPNLFSINLTRNALLNIHPDTFQNNSQLNLLTLSGNPLQLIQGKNNQNNKYFLDIPSVSDLDLSNNGLTRLTPASFVRMPRLVYLSLRNNRIRTLDQTIFKPLDQLEELDLSNNQLNSVPDDVFNFSEYLEILHISGNNLSSLATITAPRICSLDVSKNRIKIVAKDDLTGLPELEKLILKSNGLKRIHPHAFINLLNLAHLDISDNKLAALEEHHLRTNSRLETVIINDNPGLKSLPVFKAQDGTFSINRFECTDCGLRSLQAGTFDAMPMLARLNLARNSLSRLPAGLFREISGLKELDLSDNQFSTLEPNMFLDAVTLTKLSLAGNPLTAIETTPFLNTLSLSRLDLSRCGLDRIWTDSNSPIESLRFMSVRGNHIDKITVKNLKMTPKISSLDISNNPFECDQDFNEVVQYLIDQGISPTETLRYMNNQDDAEYFPIPHGLDKWTDLAKVICESIEDGPPPRKAPRRQSTAKSVDPMPLSDLDELAKPFDHGLSPNDEEMEDAWLSRDQEYEEYPVVGANYRPWYGGTLWPVMTVILVTLAVVLFVVNFAVYLSKRRGRGPVIRAPMILRPGLIDNKNCGLVYKPLQEEIPTPQMAKRGSFYSSSTFHYDKIVPESV